MSQEMKRMLHGLGNALNGQKATATFACGGTIKPTPEALSTFMFYEDKARQVHRIDFPASEDAMEKLSKDCDQATFGVGTVETLDTEYRSAWKLDSSKFLTSFTPLQGNVLEVVRQLLFPGNIGGSSISAELYKLNIYKGPHDRFKPHVDTPRADTQFASLVVCFPAAHTGGELMVRHDGREVMFDWSEDNQQIQWAAFYSDCEHEVLPVTSGYRLTITYNLYFNLENPAFCLGDYDLTSLPLYDMLSECLHCEEFMPEGGILGAYCYHDYAHASDAAEERLKNVKGVDAALWAVCNDLGLKTACFPIYSPESGQFDYENSDDGSNETGNLSNDQFHDLLTQKLGKMPSADNKYEVTNFLRKLVTYIKKYKTIEYLFGEDACEIQTDTQGKVSWLRNEFGPVRYHWNFGCNEDSLESRLRGQDVLDKVRGIYWINEPRHREVNLAYTTYGNEPGAGFLYSSAAILILIPKYNDRVGPAKDEGGITNQSQDSNQLDADMMM